MSGTVTPIVDGAPSAGDIVDLSEAIDDRVDALLVAGPNITLNYNDTVGALTISAASGGGLDVLDEGSTLSGSAFDSLDFVGAGVTVTDAGGGVAQVSIPGGGGGSLEVRDEGTTLTSAAGFLDFRGAGVAATTVSGGVQVSIPGASGGEPGVLTMTPPTVSSFVNTYAAGRSGTFTDVSYGVQIRGVSPSGTGNGFVSGWWALPSAGANGRRMITRLRPLLPMQFARYYISGIALRNSSSGLIRCLGPCFDTAAGIYRLDYTSVTTASAIGFVRNFYGSECWLAVEITNAGTRRWLFSVNGIDWVLMLSEANTTHMTPDQWGVGFDPISNGTYTGETLGVDVLHASSGGY